MARRVPERQVPGVHHRRVGADVVVTAVSDGHLDGSMAVIQNIEPEEAARMLRDSFRPVPRRTAVNAFLVHAGGKLALVDAGCGDATAATAGKLGENLAAAGVRPEEVDAVLLTHMHPDHSNGLADAEGRAPFPRAELVMHEAEWAYWNDDAAMARADEASRERGFLAARAQAAPCRDRLRLHKGGGVFPGVAAMPFPSHTSGHTGYMVASGNDSLLIWGDVVHVPEIQVPRPEVAMSFDVDPAQAEATRRRVFDMAADGQAFTGMHLHFPGHARMLRRHGGGHALLPEVWAAGF